MQIETRQGLKGIHVLIGGFVGGLTALLFGFLFFIFIAKWISCNSTICIIIRSLCIGTIVITCGVFGMSFSLSSQKDNDRYYKKNETYYAAIEGIGVGTAVCTVLIIFSDLYEPFCVGIGGLLGACSGGMRYIKGGYIKRIFWLFGGIVGLIIGVFNNSTLNGFAGGACGVLIGFILGGLLGLIIEDFYGIMD